MDLFTIKPEILVTSLRSNLRNINLVSDVEYVGAHSLLVRSVLICPDGQHDTLSVEMNIFGAMGEQLLFQVTDGGRTLQAMKRRGPLKMSAMSMLRELVQPPMQMFKSTPQLRVDSGTIIADTEQPVQLPDCVLNVLMASHAARWAAVGASLGK